MTIDDLIKQSVEEMWADGVEELTKGAMYRANHLHNLIARASYIQGVHSQQAYIITSPIPPLLASESKQNEAYTMFNTVIRHRFSKEIAEELIKDKEAFAHMYALERLDAGNNIPLWRDVLSWLDELEKPNGGMDKGS